MPAPGNDNFASATVLASQISGQVLGTNVEATAETGEPANFGRSVWFKWTPPGLGRYRFATRYKSGAIAQTDFATVLSIFQPTNPPPRVTALNLLGSNGRFAGWETGSEVIVALLTTTDPIWIRVDGYQGASGNILLWWEAFEPVFMRRCGECPPQPDSAEECIVSWQIDPAGGKADLELPLVPNGPPGNFPPGGYIVRFCGLPWSYNVGPGRWVATTVPHDALQTWPGQAIPGRFVAVEYSAAAGQGSGLSTPFSEAQPPGGGYPSQAVAMALTRCIRADLPHTGGSIWFHFSDNAYGDNSTVTAFPRFSLYRVRPKFAVVLTGIFWTGVGNIYFASFYVQNQRDAAFAGITFALQATGGISSPVVASPQPVTFSALETKQIDFQMSMDRSSSGAPHAYAIATIRVNDPIARLEDLVVDLSPILLTTLDNIYTPFCSGPKWGARFTIKNIGFGPTIRLKATIEQTGGVTQVSDQDTCAPRTVFDLGEVFPGGGTVPLVFHFIPSPVGTPQVTFTIRFSDGSITLPPAQITASVPIVHSSAPAPELRLTEDGDTRLTEDGTEREI